MPWSPWRTTSASYDRVTGREPTPMPSTAVATWLPVGVAAFGVLLLALAIWRPTSGALARWLWRGGLVVTLAALALAPRALGYPARMIWLWEPAVMLAPLPLVAALLLGAGRSFVPTAGGRWRPNSHGGVRFSRAPRIKEAPPGR